VCEETNRSETSFSNASAHTRTNEQTDERNRHRQSNQSERHFRFERECDRFDDDDDDFSRVAQPFLSGRDSAAKCSVQSSHRTTRVGQSWVREENAQHSVSGHCVRHHVRILHVQLGGLVTYRVHSSDHRLNLSVSSFPLSLSLSLSLSLVPVVTRLVRRSTDVGRHFRFIVVRTSERRLSSSFFCGRFLRLRCRRARFASTVGNVEPAPFEGSPDGICCDEQTKMTSALTNS
jgi:hypothetical protein